jgi:hypothetical protein
MFKNKYSSWVILIVILNLIHLNCSTTNLGSFKEISINSPSDKINFQDSPIKGEDCTIQHFFTWFSTPRIDRAIDDALSKVKGAKGMKDIKIHYFASVPINYVCFRVEGIATK